MASPFSPALLRSALDKAFVNGAGRATSHQRLTWTHFRNDFTPPCGTSAKSAHSSDFGTQHDLCLGRRCIHASSAHSSALPEEIWVTAFNELGQRINHAFVRPESYQ